MTPTVRSADADDAAAMAAIYNHFVVDTVVTFEEAVVTAAEMRRRMAEIATASLPCLVLQVGAELLGYAHASKWKVRHGYRFSVETTIYLRPDASGQGHGTCLYRELIEQLRVRQVHTAIGGIALPNAASVRVHERLGFVKVAHFKEVGFKLQRWVDVGYWQLLLS